MPVAGCPSVLPTFSKHLALASSISLELCDIMLFMATNSLFGRPFLTNVLYLLSFSE